MNATYEADFHAWTHEQAGHLRAGRLSEIDIEHLAEELDHMGARERRELNHRLAVLLAHLLQWQHQPERRGNSWRLTIEVHRLDLSELLDKTPASAPGSVTTSAPPIGRRRCLPPRNPDSAKAIFPPNVPTPRTASRTRLIGPNNPSRGIGPGACH